MPFGDGTGPGGYGPMTGRAAGFCAGYAVPGYANPVFAALGAGEGAEEVEAAVAGGTGIMQQA